MCIRIVLIYPDFLVLGRGELRMVGCHVWRLICIDFLNLFKHTASQLAATLNDAAASPLVLGRES